MSTIRLNINIQRKYLVTKLTGLWRVTGDDFEKQELAITIDFGEFQRVFVPKQRWCFTEPPLKRHQRIDLNSIELDDRTHDQLLYWCELWEAAKGDESLRPFITRNSAPTKFAGMRKYLLGKVVSGEDAEFFKEWFKSNKVIDCPHEALLVLVSRLGGLTKEFTAPGFEDCLLASRN